MHEPTTVSTSRFVIGSTAGLRAMVLATGAILAGVAGVNAADKPNILLLVADDLGYADVGFNGGRIFATPNLDRLAATGVNLTDFRACPMCSPTRAGLLTGRWPLRFGMMRAVVPPWSTYGLPSEEDTLPELLAAAGYERRGIIGKWHLGHARRAYLPRNHGFTRFVGCYNGAIDYFSDNGGIPRVGSSNAPYRGAKLTVYEGGTRVCAAVRWPAGRLLSGQRFDGRIGYIDVVPTLLAAAGLELPGNLDGLDFLPALRGQAALPERPWFSYMHQNQEAHASVHLGPWKLVAHGDVFAEQPSAAPALELYNLSTDPAETNDVAARRPDIVAQLHRRLREFGSWQSPGVTRYNEGRDGFVAPTDWMITR
jgi:arylsulfatase A-like enzyme